MLEQLENTENQEQSTNATQEESQQTTQESTQSQQSSKEQNLARLRERAEAAERRLQEYENEQRKLQEAQQQQKAQSDNEYEIDDDMYLEGRQFKKALKPWQDKLTKAEQQYKETQDKLAQLEQQRMLNQAEQRVQKEFPDFSSIVTQDNLKKLELTKPHLYHAIKDTTDVYSKAASAYEMIKNAGILEPNPEQEERIQQNQGKPRSASGIGGQSASNSPLTRVGEYDRRVMTPERRAELQRIMQQYKQG